MAESLDRVMVAERKKDQNVGPQDGTLSAIVPTDTLSLHLAFYVFRKREAVLLQRYALASDSIISSR